MQATNTELENLRNRFDDLDEVVAKLQDIELKNKINGCLEGARFYLKTCEAVIDSNKNPIDESYDNCFEFGQLINQVKAMLEPIMPEYKDEDINKAFETMIETGMIEKVKKGEITLYRFTEKVNQANQLFNPKNN